MVVTHRRRPFAARSVSGLNGHLSDIARFKRVIGDGLRSRADRRQTIEVAIAVHVHSPSHDPFRGGVPAAACQRYKAGRNGDWRPFL